MAAARVPNTKYLKFKIFTFRSGSYADWSTNFISELDTEGIRSGAEGTQLGGYTPRSPGGELGSVAARSGIENNQLASVAGRSTNKVSEFNTFDIRFNNKIYTELLNIFFRIE